MKLDLCSLTDTGGWVENVVDLSAFIGSTKTLLFEVSTDNSPETYSSFFLDDVGMSSVSTVSSVIGDEILVLGDIPRNRSK
jgi:bacillopeptidase F (M6 metalloprotease family)